jgi:hypothetical protein
MSDGDTLVQRAAELARISCDLALECKASLKNSRRRLEASQAAILKSWPMISETDKTIGVIGMSICGRGEHCAPYFDQQ